VAEIRAIPHTLPISISSRQRFDAFIARHIDRRSGTLSQEGVKKLEKCFEGSIALTIMIPGGSVVSGIARPKASPITIHFSNRQYSSRNLPANLDSLTGFDGLRFWLKTIKAHLGSESRSTCLIFIVGTHMDKVVLGAKDIRHGWVRELFNELELQIPFEYHEIGMYPIQQCNELMPGFQELKNSILDRTRESSHMGELVPKPYLAIESAISTMAKAQKMANKSNL
jgi:hypothetical protein